MWINNIGELLLVVLGCFSSTVYGYFDIFMNANETMRVLGKFWNLTFLISGNILQACLSKDLDFLDF